MVVVPMRLMMRKRPFAITRSVTASVKNVKGAVVSFCAEAIDQAQVSILVRGSRRRISDLSDDLEGDVAFRRGERTDHPHIWIGWSERAHQEQKSDERNEWIFFEVSRWIHCCSFLGFG